MEWDELAAGLSYTLVACTTECMSNVMYKVPASLSETGEVE